MPDIIRNGVRMLFFGSSTKGAEKALINRVGQYILTCSGAALLFDLRRRSQDQGRPLDAPAR